MTRSDAPRILPPSRNQTKEFTVDLKEIKALIEGEESAFFARVRKFVDINKQQAAKHMLVLDALDFLMITNK